MSLGNNRDLGVATIPARRGTYASGLSLGIILLDDEYPGFPGDVRNPSGHPFPIQYDVVTGVDIAQLVLSDDRDSCLEPILDSVRRLERLGFRAVAAECGYFAYFQEAVAARANVPVFMSSLLQVPTAQHVVGTSSKVGIMCGSRRRLTDAHLRNVGIDPQSNIVIAGATDDYHCPDFENLWLADRRPELPTADFETAERDFVAACSDFAAKHPDMKAMVFECTGFQPFARSVQREIGLPLFTWSTLLDYANSVVVHREHYGHV